MSQAANNIQQHTPLQEEQESIYMYAAGSTLDNAYSVVCAELNDGYIHKQTA